MSATEPLSNDAIQSALEGLPEWAYGNERLVRTFTFSDFRAAISFIVRLSFYAEEMNHHPELTNVYNRVTVALTTHDAGDRVTDLDVKLARAIDSFSWV